MSTREDGVSLAEVIVAVAILGIAFAVIVGALGTAIITTDIDRKQANAQNGLRSFAEEVKAETYDACPGVPAYGSSFTPPSPLVASVTVEYWNLVTFLGSCPPTDFGLQRVQLTLATPDGKITETVQLLKRRA